MVLIDCPYSRSVTDFSILFSVTQKLDQSSKLRNSFPAFICVPIFSKVCALFPHNNFCNRSLTDFSIPGDVTQKSGQRSKFQSPSQPLSLDQCFETLCGISSQYSLQISLWPILVYMTQKIRSNVKSSNSFTVFICRSWFSKFCASFPQNIPYNCAVDACSIFGNMTQKLVQWSKFS